MVYRNPKTGLGRRVSQKKLVRFFLRPEVGVFFPHFGAISLLIHTENLEKKEKHPPQISEDPGAFPTS